MYIDLRMHRNVDQVRLTDRQFEVLERLARRQTIKEIAGEFEVSESAINQQIKKLKDKFEVGSLAELQEKYAAFAKLSGKRHCRKSAARKKQLQLEHDIAETGFRNEGSEPLRFQDSMTYTVPAPWEPLREPLVVPGVLNGANSLWVRAILMFALTIALFATVIVGLGAAQGVSSALGGNRTVPGNQP